MNNEEFRHRIARIIREKETGKKYSVIGASRSDECVVRHPKTYGRNAWDKKRAK